jgi:hypothetical protein
MATTPKNKELIAEAGKLLVDGNFLFTAYELSQDVQAIQKEREMAFERHLHMREDVHAEMDRYVTAGTYAVSLITIPEAPVPVNVYHPIGIDPHDHKPLKDQRQARALNPSIISTITAQVQASASVQTVPSPLPTQVSYVIQNRNADARGTVCVPNQMIREMGFRVREKAYAYRPMAGVLVVAKSLPQGEVELTSYTVDDNHNVRITAATLLEAGLLSGANIVYDFESQHGGILVKAHR